MRRLSHLLLGAVMVVPMLVVGTATPGVAVAPGSAPSQPTPFVTSPIDLGPRAAGHPASSSCYGQNSVMTEPVGERTLIAMQCGIGMNASRVLVSFLEADGRRSEPWALVGGSNSGRVFVRDVAVDDATGDVGLILGLPDWPQQGIGLARYSAANSTWTSLTPQAIDAGAQAPCVEPSFTWSLELGGLMADGQLTVVAPFSREVELADPPFTTTGEVRLLASTWSGSECSPDFRSFVIASGGALLPDTGNADVVDLEVAKVVGGRSAVVTVNRGHGTPGWSDDTFEVLGVDPSDGEVNTLIEATPGRARAIDLVEDAGGSTALVSTQGVAPVRVMAVPLAGGAHVTVPDAEFAMPFVDRDPYFDDAFAIPQGLDRATAAGRNAAMIFDSSRVGYEGDQSAYGPFLTPRTPQIRVAWRDAALPGEVRVVPLPTSDTDDPVQWRVPNVTAVRIVVTDGVPVLTAPCGMDESARTWHCVSTWNADSGWHPPQAVRQAVIPAWPVAGGEGSVLVASMTDASVRLVVPDTTAPEVSVNVDGPTAVESGSVVQGSVVASDDNEGREVACAVELGESTLATSTIPVHDDNAAFPAPSKGPLTLAWMTPELTVGLHDVHVWCTDRAGNRSLEQVLELEARLSPPGAPTDVVVTGGDGEVAVAWSPPASAPERVGASGYRVEHRSAGSDDPATFIVDGSTNQARISGLVNGELYDVRVVPLSEVGEGIPSEWLSVTPLSAPGAPRGLVVRARSAGVLASWLPPLPDSSQRTPSAYMVEVRDAATGLKVGGCATTATSCGVTGLTNGRLVDVRVGTTATAQTTWVSVRPIAVPVAPKIRAVVWRSDGRAQLYWVPSSSTSAPVQGYRVLLNGRYKGTASSGGASSFVLTGLQQGVRYTFTVEAFNAIGRASTTSPALIRPIP